MPILLTVGASLHEPRMGRNRIAWRRQPQDRNRIASARPQPPDGGDSKDAPLRHKYRALTRRAVRCRRIRG